MKSYSEFPQRVLLLSIVQLLLALSGTHLVLGADRTNKPEFDWAADGKVDFCAQSNTFDYRNAYWMGALSYFSYWHLKYVDQLIKSEAGTPVSINFESENAIFKSMGLGTLRTTYFSSALSQPESSQKYDNLVRRWYPPLPGEACIKPEMYLCFGPAVSRTNPSVELIKHCGEHNEKALMEINRLKNIQNLVKGKKLTQKEEKQARFDKKRIEGLVKKYELKNSLSVGLDWNKDEAILRCEQYKFHDDLIPDTQGALFENKDAITIVFRGTEEGNTTDIMTDLLATNKIDLSLNSKMQGNVHEGFYKAARILRDWVIREISEIRKLRPESINKPIFITGHSLGGAIANLVMYNLLERKEHNDHESLNLKALYTFGAPRVGDNIWATRFRDLAIEKNVGLYRMVNLNDLIPHVPCFGYVHSGALVFMDSSSESFKTTREAVSVLANPVDSVLSIASLHSSFSACGIASALLKPWSIESMISDHFMVSYYKDLSLLRSNFNKTLNQALYKTVLAGDMEGKQALSFPGSCNQSKYTPILDGALKLNYQYLTPEVEGGVGGVRF
jgi:hypothetical protein